jgi:hypothetical protein
VNRFKDPEQPRQAPHLCRMDSHLAEDNREKCCWGRGLKEDYNNRSADDKFFCCRGSGRLNLDRSCNLTGIGLSGILRRQRTEIVGGGPRGRCVMGRVCCCAGLPSE